jgi:hypothetical protein
MGWKDIGLADRTDDIKTSTSAVAALFPTALTFGLLACATDRKPT